MAAFAIYETGVLTAYREPAEGRVPRERERVPLLDLGVSISAVNAPSRRW